MSTETWGNLPKALDDATTIDQAIAAAIAAHEADSEAHLGAGESLETHRANEVLDHPSDSVVADKFSPYTILEGPGAFNDFQYVEWEGTITTKGPRQLIVNMSGQTEFDGGFNTGYGLDSTTDGAVIDITFTMAVGQSNQSDGDLRVGFGYDNDIEANVLEIYKTGTTYYLRVLEDSGWVNLVTLGSGSFADQRLRFLWRLNDEEIDVYKNGTLIATIPYGDIDYPSPWEVAGIVNIYMTRSTATLRYMSMYLWRGLYNIPE